MQSILMLLIFICWHNHVTSLMPSYCPIGNQCYPAVRQRSNLDPRGGGGGHCLFECKYPLPNYRPCFSVLSAGQSFFIAPYFLGSYTITPQNQYKIIYKSDPKSSKQLYIFIQLYIKNAMYLIKYREYKHQS